MGINERILTGFFLCKPAFPSAISMQYYCTDIYYHCFALFVKDHSIISHNKIVSRFLTNPLSDGTKQFNMVVNRILRPFKARIMSRLLQ